MIVGVCKFSDIGESERETILHPRQAMPYYTHGTEKQASNEVEQEQAALAEPRGQTAMMHH